MKLKRTLALLLTFTMICGLLTVIPVSPASAEAAPWVNAVRMSPLSDLNFTSVAEFRTVKAIDYNTAAAWKAPGDYCFLLYDYDCEKDTVSFLQFINGEVTDKYTVSWKDFVRSYYVNIYAGDFYYSAYEVRAFHFEDYYLEFEMADWALRTSSERVIFTLDFLLRTPSRVFFTKDSV